MALPILLHEGPGGMDLHAKARNRRSMMIAGEIVVILLVLLLIRSRRSKSTE